MMAGIMIECTPKGQLEFEAVAKDSDGSVRITVHPRKHPLVTDVVIYYPDCVLSSMAMEFNHAKTGGLWKKLELNLITVQPEFLKHGYQVEPNLSEVSLRYFGESLLIKKDGVQIGEVRYDGEISTDPEHFEDLAKLVLPFLSRTPENMKIVARAEFEKERYKVASFLRRLNPFWKVNDYY